MTGDIPAAKDDVFIWGNYNHLTGDKLSLDETYVERHSCVNGIARFNVGDSGMLYSKLKPKILDKLRGDCYAMLHNMPTSHTYTTLPEGRSEFLHQAIAGGYIDVDSVEIIKMFISESIYNFAMEYRNTRGGEIDTLDKNNLFELLSVSVNLTKMHDYHRTHDHQCDLSGAIYLDVDTSVINDDNAPQGCIEWFTTFNTFIRISNPHAYACFLPKSGDCCLWRGDIPHHVYPTFKPNNRLMITYNANFNIDTNQLPGEAQTL